MRYFRPKFFYFSFQFVQVSKRLVESVFIHFFFYFVPEMVVKRITIWGWWGPFCVLHKPFAHFFLQENLSNIGTTWWCTILNKNPIVAIHNTIDFGKKLFFQMFFISCGINFQTLIVHKKRFRSTFSRYASRNHYLFRLPIGVIAIFVNIKGDYFEYYLYFQIHRHGCFESLVKNLN